jgi:hypothetical protein
MYNSIMSGNKTIKFSKSNIDWMQGEALSTSQKESLAFFDRWMDLAGKEREDMDTKIQNLTEECINNHNPDNIDPDCVCLRLADEFDGAEVTQPLLAGLSASKCKDAFKFDELANDFCNVDANNFKSALGPPGDTCISRDNNNSNRLKYCKLEDKIKSDGECTKTKWVKISTTRRRKRIVMRTQRISGVNVITF